MNRVTMDGQAVARATRDCTRYWTEETAAHATPTECDLASATARTEAIAPEADWWKAEAHRELLIAVRRKRVAEISHRSNLKLKPGQRLANGLPRSSSMILDVLCSAPINRAEIERATGLAAGTVYCGLRWLAKRGLVRVAERRKVAGCKESPFYVRVDDADSAS